MNFNIQVAGIQNVQASLGNLPSAVHSVLVQKFDDLGRILTSKIVDTKLSGQVLQRRSGRLARSVRHMVTTGNDNIILVVGSRGVRYNAIHEFGGTTRAHTILSRKGRVMAFLYGGRTIFTERVRHPGSRIPARPYMMSTLNENRRMITEFIEAAVSSELRRAGF